MKHAVSTVRVSVARCSSVCDSETDLLVLHTDCRVLRVVQGIYLTLRCLATFSFLAMLHDVREILFGDAFDPRNACLIVGLTSCEA